MNKFELEFHPVSEEPTEPGDYVIYNQCDGLHIVEAWFDGGEFIDFWEFAAPHAVGRDFYRAWAKLPDSMELYKVFSRDAEDAAK